MQERLRALVEVKGDGAAIEDSAGLRQPITTRRLSTSHRAGNVVDNLVQNLMC